MNKITQFQGIEVTIHEIDGQVYLSSKDICRCLGIAQSSLSLIIKNHQDELTPYGD
jgi:prophage antirepressor-like protein